MSAKARWPTGPLIVLLAGTIGTVLSLYSYLAPLTGITHSPGALLVIGSSLALAIDGLILRRARAGAVFWIFWVLGVLGALGTASAAGFLHSWWLMGASLVVLAGLLLTLTPQGGTEGVAA